MNRDALYLGSAAIFGLALGVALAAWKDAADAR